MHPSRTRVLAARPSRPARIVLALALLLLGLLVPAAAQARTRDCAAGRRGARSARSCSRRRRTRARHARARRARARTHADAGRGSARRAQRTETRSASSSDSLAAVVAAVLAAPCAETEIIPERENLPAVRAAVLCLINRKRAEHEERPLTENAALDAAAESHDAEMIADDYFAHVSPSGETPVERIRDMGYLPSAEDGYILGENLAWGTYQLSTAQSIAEAWFASPPHLANILESQYRETGIAVVAAVPEAYGDGAPGALYAQEFGVVLS